MKRALVVGGSGAIGRATADVLIESGWDVIQSHFTALVESGPHIDLHATEFEEVIRKIGPVDALIFASGINRPGPLSEMTAGGFDEIMTVNARGPLLFVRDIWDTLPDGASITFVGSCSGQIGGPITPHYAMSKAALTALTKHLARHGAHRDIRVNTVAPGWVEGPWVKAAPVEIPLRRLCTPREVAEAILFVVSSGYVTGQTIGVNGGAHFSD